MARSNTQTGITLHNNSFGGVTVSNGARKDLRATLESAKLNFQVERQAMYLAEGSKVPDAMAIVRTDTKAILGTVGNKYRPVQNDAAFGVFQQAFDSGILEVELAGQLGGGKIVWVQARVVGDPLVVTGEDVIRPYVLLANSHDGSLALRAGFTAVRLFCYNQMAAATKHGSLVSLRHTQNVNLESLRSGIQAGRENLVKVVESARWLVGRKVPSNDVLNTYTRRSFGLDENVPCRMDGQVQELFESGIGAGYKPTRGSWWSAYNSITEYLTHHRGRNQDSRTKSLWFGDSAKVIGTALEVAIQMAA